MSDVEVDGRSRPRGSARRRGSSPAWSSGSAPAAPRSTRSGASARSSSAGDLREVLGIPTSSASEAAGHRAQRPADHARRAPRGRSHDRRRRRGRPRAQPRSRAAGGALWREKIVAQASLREVIVVDDTKPSPQLGTRSVLPVEVAQFGWRPEDEYLDDLGADGHRPARRRRRRVRDRRGELDPRLHVRRRSRTRPASRPSSTGVPGSWSTACSSVSRPTSSSRAPAGVEHRTRP